MRKRFLIRGNPVVEQVSCAPDPSSSRRKTIRGRAVEQQESCGSQPNLPKPKEA